MGNFQTLNSLSEQDNLTIQEVNGHLLTCRTRALLRTIFESQILPLLNADSAIYAWTDPDLLSPRLIDSINISEEELVLINRFVSNDPQAGCLLTHTHPIIARDIDIPAGNDTERDDPFQGEPLREDPFSGRQPTEKDGYGYFSTSKAGVITLALRDSNPGSRNSQASAL